MKRWILLIFAACCIGGAVLLSRQPVDTAGAAPEELIEEVGTVSLFGREWPENSHELTLNGKCSTAELRRALSEFTELKTVVWESCPLNNAEKKSFLGDFPALTFDWTLHVGDCYFSSLDEEIDLSGEKKNVDALVDLLPLMSAKRIMLEGWNLTAEEVMRLRERAGDAVAFVYSVELYGQRFSNEESEIDLSDIPLSDTVELEAALIHFPNLTRVLMVDCGLDNNTMDALNERHEGIKFVWMVQVMTLGVLSDKTYFTIYNADRLYQTRESVENLRYCHDLIAVDLGHCGIGQQDLEFVRGCPKLQFLIIIEGNCNSLEPLRQCPELRYLEAFKTNLTDISALLDCPKLTDLNLSYIPSLGADCVDTLSQMKQLQHLWFYDANFSAAKIIELQNALPDTEFTYYKGPESTGGGWRTHDIYYEMRDSLHMNYMG